MKHAFLIMAHGNWELLGRLIKKLDHPDNDLFLHIDKKADFSDEKKELLIKCVCSSHLYFTERIKVTWGGFSMIQSELLLLKEAFSRRNYRYFHLMSGLDFPIKKMSYIHDYFMNNDGGEFVDLEKNKLTERIVEQYRYYHPLQEIIGRSGSRRNFFYLLEFYILKLQVLLGIDRRKKNPDIHFYKSPQWWSITDDFVKYILSKEQWINKCFGMTKCSDEMFVPTLLFNSSFATKQKPYMRLIDWSRGNPYIFTINERKEIEESNNLFIRKVGLANKNQSDLVDYLETI